MDGREVKISYLGDRVLTEEEFAQLKEAFVTHMARGRLILILLPEATPLPVLEGEDDEQDPREGCSNRRQG